VTYYEMHAPIRKKTPAVLAGLALFIAGALSIGGINLLGAYAGFEFLPLLVLAIWPRNAHNLLSLAFVFAAGLFTDWATGVTVGQWALVFTVIWGVMRPELRSTPYAPLSFSAMWFAICGLSLVLVSVSGWFVKGIMPDFTVLGLQIILATLFIPLVLLLRRMVAKRVGDREEWAG